MLGHLNVTLKLGELRKALEHEEDGCKAAKRLMEADAKMLADMDAKLKEATETIKKVNAELADKDAECCRLRQELANAPKRHTLTDLEIATIKELRKMTEDRSIHLGAKGRAVLTNAANFISSKGDI